MMSKASAKLVMLKGWNRYGVLLMLGQAGAPSSGYIFTELLCYACLPCKEQLRSADAQQCRQEQSQELQVPTLAAAEHAQ